MITQNVKGKKLGAVEGILLIVAIAAGLFAAALAASFFARKGNAVWGQLGVWLLAGLCAFWLMKTLLAEYQYTIASGKFYIERVFGGHSRVMLEVALEDVLFIGGDKEAAGRYPDSRIEANATVSGSEIQKKCMAYRAGGKVCLMLFQPDAAVEKALEGRLS